MEHIIKRPDEPDILTRSWAPKVSKGVVCVIHGLGEHIGRYDGYAAAMNKAGYTLMGGDLRGHGQSGGDRGFTRTLEDILTDVDAIVLRAKELAADKPLFLFGHSMGGGLALRYAMEFPDAGFAGVIASAPLIEPVEKVGGVQRGLVRIVSKLAPKFSISPGLDGKKISSIEAEGKRYENDPLNHGKLTGKLAIAIVENGEWLQIHGGNFPYPLLTVHSHQDPLTSFEKSKAFTERAAGQFVSFDESRHEIHHDVDAPALFKTVTAFLDNHIP